MTSRHVAGGIAETPQAYPRGSARGKWRASLVSTCAGNRRRGRRLAAALHRAERATRGQSDGSRTPGRRVGHAIQGRRRGAPPLASTLLLNRDDRHVDRARAGSNRLPVRGLPRRASCTSSSARSSRGQRSAQADASRTCAARSVNCSANRTAVPCSRCWRWAWWATRCGGSSRPSRMPTGRARHPRR